MAKIPTNPRFKCYFGCERGPVHYFPQPHDTERFNVWKAVLDEELREKGNKYIYNQLRLCNKHFESFYLSSSGRLTRNAIPTLLIKKDSDNITPVPTDTCIESVPTVSAVQGTKKSLKRKHEKDMPSGLQVGVLSSQPSKLKASSTVAKDTNIKLQRKSRKGPNKSLILIKKLKERMSKLIMKCKTTSKKIATAKKLSEKEQYLRLFEAMPPSINTFIQMQMKIKQKPKGRRFTLEEKIMAASIMKQSQKGYNFLSKIVVLPTKRSIQRLLSSFAVKPGINENIINNIKESVKGVPLERRIYTLLFDEVALSPGLYFDRKEITGFEDFGNKRTDRLADHALVMMIKGVKIKKKQPVLFTFCKSTTTKYQLKEMLVHTIRYLRNAGIIVIATICDQATTNVSTIKMLQKDTREKYLKKNTEYTSNAFEVDDQKVFPLFDTPHLLKGVRNNFITKNIKYKQDDKVKIAKWAHLRLLLNEDIGEDEVRIVNKLTEHHVDPEKIPKMKVKYASQVFSQRVSAVMRYLAQRKILPEECGDTADLLLLFDKLFDSFNGHSYQDTAKPLKGCLKINSKHFQFWDEILPILKSIEFEKKKKNRWHRNY